MDGAASSGAWQHVNTNNHVWPVYRTGLKTVSSSAQSTAACQAPQSATLASDGRRLPSISTVFEDHSQTLRTLSGSPTFGSPLHAVPRSLESLEPFLKRRRLSCDQGPVPGLASGDDVVTAKVSVSVVVPYFVGAMLELRCCGPYQQCWFSWLP